MYGDPYGDPLPASYAGTGDDDPFSPPADPAALAQVRHDLGLPGSQAPQRPRPGPDVHGLAEELGLA